jgi:hypothetical protein
MKTNLLFALLAVTASGAAAAAEADHLAATDAATAVLAQSWPLRLADEPADASAEARPTSTENHPFTAGRPVRMVLPNSSEMR